MTFTYSCFAYDHVWPPVSIVAKPSGITAIHAGHIHSMRSAPTLGSILQMIEGKIPKQDLRQLQRGLFRDLTLPVLHAFVASKNGATTFAGLGAGDILQIGVAGGITS